MELAYDPNEPNPIDANNGPAAASPEAVYWEIGEKDNFTDNMSQDYEFSELVTLGNENTSNSKGVLIAMLVILFGGFAYVGYEYMETGEIPGEALVMELMGEFGGAAEPYVPGPRKKTAKKKALTEEVVPKAAPMPEGIDAVVGNPYWSLPNKIVGDRVLINRQWTTEEEEVLRSGLNHQFTWQRHKTVLDVRNQMLRGSEVILWDALGERKFWTRMHAAIGLADFNVPITIPQVEEAIGDAHSDLVARFFKRFIKKSTAGTRYMARQSIKILDARGRLSILKVLNRNPDELRDLYMVAASQDPSPRIQGWLRSALAERPVKMGDWDRLLQMVQGSIAATIAAEEATDMDAVSEEGLEEDLAELDEEAMGDVEFYEGDVEVDDALSSEYSEY